MNFHTIIQNFCFVFQHFKNSIGKIRIFCLYKEVHHTVQNKGDLDSVIKTKTLIVKALKSYLNVLYSVPSFFPLTISNSENTPQGKCEIVMVFKFFKE